MLFRSHEIQLNVIDERGGEAKALEIYANAFNKDPEFYEFMRTLEAYKKVIDNKTTLVLPADSKLFKTLNE